MKNSKKLGLIVATCLVAGFAFSQKDRSTYLPIDVTLASSNHVGSMNIAANIAPDAEVPNLDFYSTEFKMRILEVEAAFKLGLSTVDLGASGSYVTIVADYMRFRTVPVTVTIDATTFDAVAYVGVDCRLQFVTSAAQAKLAVTSGAAGIDVSIKYFSESLALGAYGFKEFEPFTIPTDNNGTIKSGKLKNVLIGAFNSLMAQSGPFKPKLLGMSLTGSQSKLITDAIGANTKVEVKRA